MKKPIYLEASEEITSVINKIKQTRQKEIFLVVPPRAVLFSSLVNLKILKKKAAELKKEIYLVTTDKTGQKLAQNAGLFVLSKIDESAKIDLGLDKKEIHKDEKETFVNVGKIKRDMVWRSFVSGFSIASFLILLVIIFIILPKATISATVQSKDYLISLKITVSRAVTSVDFDKNVIPGLVSEVVLEKSNKFPTTGKTNIGQKARGSIYIYNHTGQSFGLIAQTRFKVLDKKLPDGGEMIFKSDQGVHLSANPARPTIVPVTAEKGGAVYNIKPSRFSIVLLPWSGLECVSKSSMTGGTDKYIYSLIASDVEKAKKELMNELYNEAKSQIKSGLPASKIALDETFQKKVLSFSYSPSLGTQTSDFEAKMKLKVYSVVFEKQDITDLVVDEISKNVPFNRYLYDSGKDKITYKLEKIDLIQGLMILDVKTIARTAILINQPEIIARLAGLSEKEAQAYLKNVKEFSDIKIDFWPGWFKKIPVLENRIKLEIEYR